MKHDAPCFNCEKRSTSCHAGCETYATWKSARDKKNQEDHEAKKKRWEYTGYKEELMNGIMRHKKFYK